MGREIDPRDCQHGMADTEDSEINRLRVRLSEVERERDHYKEQFLAQGDCVGRLIQDIDRLTSDLSIYKEALERISRQRVAVRSIAGMMVTDAQEALAKIGGEGGEK